MGSRDNLPFGRNQNCSNGHLALEGPLLRLNQGLTHVCFMLIHGSTPTKSRFILKFAEALSVARCPWSLVKRRMAQSGKDSKPQAVNGEQLRSQRISGLPFTKSPRHLVGHNGPLTADNGHYRSRRPLSISSTTLAAASTGLSAVRMGRPTTI